MSSLLDVRDVSDVAQRLTALAAAVEVGAGRLPTDLLAEARGVLDRAGERLRLSGHHTVVALAGATGSGKSSLFNALVGAQVSPVGVRRPTTGRPLACVWGPEGAGPLLERLGVRRRDTTTLPAADGRGASELDGLVLVDLPDHDSRDLTHRAQVDRLLELVDLFVWVVDPQKYADAVLHEAYLRPLAAHAAVTVVAFNQVDRVDVAQAGECLADLRRLLAADGLAAARVVVTSARTGEGIDELRSVLADAVRARAARTARISADLDRVVARLAEEVRAPEPGAIGRKERLRLAAALESAAGVPAVSDAAAASYRAAAVRATGWPLTRWVRRLRRDPLRRLGVGPGAAGGLTASQALPSRHPVARAQVETAVRAAAVSVADALPASWVAAVRQAVPVDDPRTVSAVDEAVTGADLTTFPRPLWWRLLGLLQVLLVLGLVAGLGWLALLFALDWLRVPEPPTADWHGWPVPTLLTVGGVAGGLLVALLGRLFARVGARRRARRVRALLRDRLAEAAAATVLEPLRAEIDAYVRVRRELRRAGARL